jgi:hypothetical protein
LIGITLAFVPEFVATRLMILFTINFNQSLAQMGGNLLPDVVG